MSLIAGKYLRRKKCTELPMPNWVTERVHFMEQKQGQMWIPRGVSIFATSKRGDNMTVMTSDTDEDIMEEDNWLALADEVTEDVTDTDPFGLKDTEQMVMDDLGLHDVVSTSAEEPSDAAEEQVDKDIMDDNSRLPLGEWINLQR